VSPAMPPPSMVMRSGLAVAIMKGYVHYGDNVLQT
jgi:hypothetical protein